MKKLKLLIPALPALLSAAYLLYILETYTAHSDADFGACLGTGVFAFISFLILLRSEAKRPSRAYRIACLAGLVVCGLLLLTASTIPNCPMCDGWQEGEFHLLSHWIKMQ